MFCQRKIHSLSIISIKCIQCKSLQVADFARPQDSKLWSHDQHSECKSIYKILMLASSHYLHFAENPIRFNAVVTKKFDLSE